MFLTCKVRKINVNSFYFNKIFLKCAEFYASVPLFTVQKEHPSWFLVSTTDANNYVQGYSYRITEQLFLFVSFSLNANQAVEVVFLVRLNSVAQRYNDYSVGIVSVLLNEFLLNLFSTFL